MSEITHSSNKRANTNSAEEAGYKNPYKIHNHIVSEKEGKKTNRKNNKIN